jgi:hypothetical protein
MYAACIKILLKHTSLKAYAQQATKQRLLIRVLQLEQLCAKQANGFFHDDQTKAVALVADEFRYGSMQEKSRRSIVDVDPLLPVQESDCHVFTFTDGAGIKGSLIQHILAELRVILGKQVAAKEKQRQQKTVFDVTMILSVHKVSKPAKNKTPENNELAKSYNRKKDKKLC